MPPPAEGDCGKSGKSDKNTTSANAVKLKMESQHKLSGHTVFIRLIAQYRIIAQSPAIAQDSRNTRDNRPYHKQAPTHAHDGSHNK